jgi:hypothetical protein
VANRAVPVGVHMPFCQLTTCDPDDPHDPRAQPTRLCGPQETRDKLLEARVWAWRAKVAAILSDSARSQKGAYVRFR